MADMQPMEDKDFNAPGSYFPVGVHQVGITKAERGKSPKTGTEFIEMTVVGEGDEEGSARMYLSEKAAPWTRRTLATIAVHNKSTEPEKEAVRKAFKNILSTDKFDGMFLSKFEGMEAWISVEEDLDAPKPNGGYYTRTNIFGYEPKPRKTTAADLVSDFKAKGAEDVDVSTIPF